MYIINFSDLFVLDGRQDPPNLPQNHLEEVVGEIVENLERWHFAEILADGAEIHEDIIEDVGGDEVEEEEVDIDWVSPLSKEYSKPFSKS